jgi:hypothetical protein
MNGTIVKTFNTRLEAELAKGLLDSQGIGAFIMADDTGNMSPFPFQPNTSGVKLVVKNEDAELAKKLLQEKSSKE